MVSTEFKGVGLHYTAFRDAIREDSRQTTPSRGITPQKKFAVEANVESRVKQPGDQQTVGLIICREKDRVTVQYALESSSLPIGVSDYVLERFIPADFKSQMPTIEEVEGELTRRMEIAKERRIEVSHTEV